MPIRITSEQARKNPSPVREKESVTIPIKSEFHYILRLHVITLVEDCFIQYKGVKTLQECIDEWKKFKEILEKKL